MNLSITQLLAHWLIGVGVDPALSVLLALVLFLVVPLLLAIGVVEVVERRGRRQRGPVFRGV
jgi:membrane protein implicated in regulation of membrane protease activity